MLLLWRQKKDVSNVNIKDFWCTKEVTPSSYNLSVFMHKKGGDIMMWKMITGLSSYGNRGRDT